MNDSLAFCCSWPVRFKAGTRCFFSSPAREERCPNQMCLVVRCSLPASLLLRNLRSLSRPRRDDRRAARLATASNVRRPRRAKNRPAPRFTRRLHIRGSSPHSWLPDQVLSFLASLRRGARAAMRRACEGQHLHLYLDSLPGLYSMGVYCLLVHGVHRFATKRLFRAPGRRSISSVGPPREAFSHRWGAGQWARTVIENAAL